MKTVFWKAVREVDRVLRGDATKISTLREGGLMVQLREVALAIVVLAMVYGLCMGCFSLFRSTGSSMQVVASIIKVPALFFLTLVVTFPSLYVFNALVGSRLTVTAVLRLLIAALAVNLAVLSSLGPIVAFFSVSTTSYAFMVILNVLVFAGSGGLGLSFLLQTLHRLSVIEDQERIAATIDAQKPPEEPTVAVEVISGEGMPTPAPQLSKEWQAFVNVRRATPEVPGALDRLEGHMFGAHVKKVFTVWMVVFSLVGAQMGWVLRPFIGSPGDKFEWFRSRESNFFESVLAVLWNLL